MHKSRLGAIIIDCRTADLDNDAAFWSAALGCEIGPRPGPGDEHYQLLESGPTQPKVLLQKVDHPSRVHLDIEADDIEAEVRRLEELGAVRLERIRDWWVMQAPSGHRFCVVKSNRVDFDDTANVWADAS